MARDLRFVIGVLKVNNDLERMGDQAVNISERALELQQEPPLKAVVDLPLIAQTAPDFFRVVGWYDNENAYAVRCVDLLDFMVGRDS